MSPFWIINWHAAPQLKTCYYGPPPVGHLKPYAYRRENLKYSTVRVYTVYVALVLPKEVIMALYKY